MAAAGSAGRAWRFLVHALVALVVLNDAQAEPLAYVPVSGGARVQVIDTRNGSTVSQIPLAPAPIGIAIDAAHGKAYVAHQSSQLLSVIDLRTRLRTGVLQLPTDAWGLALSPDGSRAYVALSGTDRLGIVDTASLSLIGSLETGSTPRDVLVSADGTRVYVSNQFGGSITVLDAASQTVIGTFGLCAAPLGLALRPGSSIVYAVCAFDDQLVRFDTASNSVVGATSTGHGPSGVVVSPDASRIYVSSTSDDMVTVIDGVNHAALTQIAVGDGPYGVSLSGDATRLYVSNVYSHSISVVDTGNNTVLTSYALIDSAFAVGNMLAPANVPDAPVIGAATSGDHSGTLAFAAPAFDGGATISGYTATCGSASQTGLASPITVGGLVNGTTVLCQVRASNSVGDSLPSATVSVIAGLPPSAPSLVSASPGAGQATLSFTAPADDGGSPVTAYVASCDPGAVTASGLGKALVVSGLTDNTVYRCAVRARNLIGSGPWSDPLSVIPGKQGSSADLSISKTNTSDFVGGGSRVAYQIVLANPGPAAMVGVRVTDVLEAYFDQAQWQCSGAGGARCAASGQGDLDTLVDLPVGSSVAIQISALLAPLPEDPVFNVAAVAVPAAMDDPDTSNNVASDGPDVRGVFRDGFE